MNRVKDLLQLYTTFFKIGICTFGGGYAMLPMLEREVINKHKWASMEELLDYFAIGQCTPGIIAVNTATFVGYKHGGVPGGILATLGVVSPSLVIITAIAALLNNLMQYPVVGQAFVGIRIAVCALILKAIVNLVKSSMKKWWHVALGVAAFALAALAKVNTIYIVLATISGCMVAWLISGREGAGTK